MMPEEVTEREWFTERAMSPANAAKECEERGGRLCSPSELRLWRWDHGPGGDGEGMVDEKAGVPFAVWTSYRCHSCWMRNPGVGKCQGGGIFEDNYRRRLIGGGNLDSSHGKSFALATVTTATTKTKMAGRCGSDANDAPCGAGWWVDSLVTECAGPGTETGSLTGQVELKAKPKSEGGSLFGRLLGHSKLNWHKDLPKPHAEREAEVRQRRTFVSRPVVPLCCR